MGNESSHFQHEQKKGRVRWNEANLREIEANKPLRKKIDEPKTPYHPMIEGSPSTTITPDTVKTIDYAAHAEALKNALKRVALSERYNGPSGGWASSEEEGFAKQRDTVSFEERRRAHYDEFKKVKGQQQKAGSFLSDEDDNGTRNSGSCSTLRTNAREVDIEDDNDEILQIIDIGESDDLSFPQ